MNLDKKKEEEPEQTAPSFSKQQLIAAKKYTAQQRDLLNALLDDDQPYTQDQVDGLISEFLGRVEG